MISFKSKITVKLFDYFFLNPEAERYVNELAVILKVDPKNLHRKLDELEKEGILKSEFRGKERYFSLASDFPLLEQYRQIFLKTFGLERSLKKMVAGTAGVKKAYIFGSYASNRMDSSSDIDLLVVGEHSVLELQKQIVKLQKVLGREINVVNMDEKEFLARKKNDQLVKNIFKAKAIELL